jgi:DNA-binding NtrC family response regulator
VLDDPAALSRAAQARLLALLRRIERRGRTEPARCGIQIVSIQPDPVALDSLGPDLVHRLGAVAFRLPPLRTRGADVLTLARSLLDRRSRERGFQPKRLTRDACAALLAHSWPGNVRELSNHIERIVLTVEDEAIRPEHFVFTQDTAPRSPCEHPVILSIEDQDLLNALSARQDADPAVLLRRALRVGLESLYADKEGGLTQRMALREWREPLRVRLIQAVRAGASPRVLAERAELDPATLSRFSKYGAGISTRRLRALKDALDALDAEARRTGSDGSGS